MMAKKSRRNSRQAIFSKKERKFLLENEVCRVSTSHNEGLHMLLLSHISMKKTFYFLLQIMRLENIRILKSITELQRQLTFTVHQLKIRQF